MVGTIYIDMFCIFLPKKDCAFLKDNVLSDENGNLYYLSHDVVSGSDIAQCIKYMDQTKLPMHKHLLNPEGDIETRARKAKALMTPEGGSIISYM